MAPLPIQPQQPTSLDHFFAKNQTPILMSAFAAQVGHHQYIRYTQPVIEGRTTFSRYLRAGLGWGVVFIALLTKITVAKKAVREYSYPDLARTSASIKKPWKRPAPEGL